MATLYLRPNATGDETNLGQSPESGYHWDKVDEVTSDEDNSYVYNIAYIVSLRDLYNLEDTNQTRTINWIKVWIRCINFYGSSYAKTAIKTGGVAYDGSEVTFTSDWTDYYTQYTTNPQAGGAWTWTQINALQAGVSIYNKGGICFGCCTQVYVEVDYAPPQNYTRSFSIKVNLLKKYFRKNIEKKLKKSIKLVAKSINKHVRKIKKTVLKITSKLTRLIKIKLICNKVINLLIVRFKFEATKVKNIWLCIKLNSSVFKRFHVHTVISVVNSLVSLQIRNISKILSDSFTIEIISILTKARGHLFRITTELFSQILKQTNFNRINVIISKLTSNLSRINLSMRKLYIETILISEIKKFSGKVRKFNLICLLNYNKTKKLGKKLRSRIGIIFRDLFYYVNPAGKRKIKFIRERKNMKIWRTIFKEFE